MIRWMMFRCTSRLKLFIESFSHGSWAFAKIVILKVVVRVVFVRVRFLSKNPHALDGSRDDGHGNEGPCRLKHAGQDAHDHGVEQEASDENAHQARDVHTEQVGPDRSDL